MQHQRTTTKRDHYTRRYRASHSQTVCCGRETRRTTQEAGLTCWYMSVCHSTSGPGGQTTICQQLKCAISTPQVGLSATARSSVSEETTVSLQCIKRSLSIQALRCALHMHAWIQCGWGGACLPVWYYKRNATVYHRHLVSP